jgi:hypothetical protein
MTGYYVRAMHDGRWQSVDICQLTDEELDEFFKDMDPKRAVQWAKALAAWIRNNVRAGVKS